MFLVIFLYAVSALTSILGKNLLLFTTPLFLTGLRTSIAGGIILIYLLIKKQNFKIKENINVLIQISFFSFFLSNTLKFWVISKISIQKACLLYSFEPILVAFLAFYITSEKTNFNQYCYAILCISASILMINSSCQINFSIEDIVLLASIASSSIGALLTRKLILTKNIPINVTNGTSMLLGGVLALSSSLMIGNEMLINSDSCNWTHFTALLLIMIGASNIFAYNLYGNILKKHSAVFISCASLLKPFLLSLWNLVLFNQTIPINVIFFSSIIVVALLLFYKEETKLVSFSSQKS